MKQSNPINSGWATHKLENNYITEVLPQENSESDIRLPSLASGGGAPTVFGFESQWGLHSREPESCEKTLLLKTAHKISRSPTSRAERNLCQTQLLTLESFMQRPRGN